MLAQQYYAQLSSSSHHFGDTPWPVICQGLPFNPTVTYGNGAYVAVWHPYIARSTDLINWTIVYEEPTYTLSDVIFYNGYFYVGLFGLGHLTSSDGITWTAVSDGHGGKSSFGWCHILNDGSIGYSLTSSNCTTGLIGNPNPTYAYGSNAPICWCVKTNRKDLYFPDGGYCALAMNNTVFVHGNVTRNNSIRGATGTPKKAAAYLAEPRGGFTKVNLWGSAYVTNEGSCFYLRYDDESAGTTAIATQVAPEGSVRAVSIADNVVDQNSSLDALNTYVLFENGVLYQIHASAVSKLGNCPVDAMLRGLSYANGRFIVLGDEGFNASSTNGASWAIGNRI